MVKKCCVCTCPSESYIGCNISFHSFPKNEEMRQKWLCGIHVKQKITKNSVVCSRHFEPSCFYTANSRQLLIPSAVPTISPLDKNKENEVISDKLIHLPYSGTSEEEMLHPATSIETPVIAGTSSSTIEEPPKIKLCPNVMEIGVQTDNRIKYMSPIEDVLKRKIKVLSQRLNRREERLKKVNSLLLLYKKRCKKIYEVEQNMKHKIKIINNIHNILNRDKSKKGVRYFVEVNKVGLS